MTSTLYILLLIVFLVINFVFIRKMKNFSIDRKNIKLFHILFFTTILVRYLLNTRLYNRRFEIFSDEVNRGGGLLGGLEYLISALIISPYLFVFSSDTVGSKTAQSCHCQRKRFLRWSA